MFRNNLGETIFKQKYDRFTDQTWEEKSQGLVHMENKGNKKLLGNAGVM